MSHEDSDSLMEARHLRFHFPMTSFAPVEMCRHFQFIVDRYIPVAWGWFNHLQVLQLQHGVGRFRFSSKLI